MVKLASGSSLCISGTTFLKTVTLPPKLDAAALMAIRIVNWSTRRPLPRCQVLGFAGLQMFDSTHNLFRMRRERGVEKLGDRSMPPGGDPIAQLGI